MEGNIYLSDRGEAERIAEVISSANIGVARKFNLNWKNCPKHPSFCTTEWVENDMDRGVLYFLYTENNVTVGCVAYERGDQNTAFLNRLSVLPDFQERGIGENLVLYFLSHAEKERVDNVSIGIIANHHKLIEWYEKFGFTRNELKKYPHLPFDVVFMRFRCWVLK